MAGCKSDDYAQLLHRVVAAACTQGKHTQHGKPQGEVSDDQPDAREGQAGRPEVAGEARSTAEAG